MSYIKNTLGYNPCIAADDIVCLREDKYEHRNEYYSYVVVYVDVVVCMYKTPDNLLNMINRDYSLKEPPECPTMYLGLVFVNFILVMT